MSRADVAREIAACNVGKHAGTLGCGLCDRDEEIAALKFAIRAFLDGWDSTETLWDDDSIEALRRAACPPARPEEDRRG